MTKGDSLSLYSEAAFGHPPRRSEADSPNSLRGMPGGIG